jgi:hypothetical protein
MVSDGHIHHDYGGGDRRDYQALFQLSAAAAPPISQLLHQKSQKLYAALYLVLSRLFDVFAKAFSMPELSRTYAMRLAKL